MSALRRNVVAVLCTAVACVLIAFAVTQIASAQTNVGATTDAQCRSLCAIGASQNKPCPAATHIICQTLTVTGICQPVGCQATTAGGLGGGNAMSSLSSLAGQIGQLLGQLMKSSGSGSSSAAPATTGTTCTSYTPTSDPTQIGVNPCVYYVPSTTCTDPTATNYGAAATCTYANGSTTTSAESLLDSLTGTSGTSGTGDTLNASPDSGSAPLTVTFTTNPLDSTQSYTIDPGDGSGQQPTSSNGCSSSSSATCVFGMNYTYSTAGTYTATLYDDSGDTLATMSVSVENPGGSNSSGTSGVVNQVIANTTGLLDEQATATEPAALAGETAQDFPGVYGNVLLDQNGATIFAATINSSNNSETSGFYGSDTLGAQPQGIAAQLCESTPWASNFLADVIPPSFFDSLCEWGGYQVGEPQTTATQPQVTLQQTEAATVPAPTTAATSTVASVPAQAVIWAEPSSVPLGARTSIFWNSQGVTECTETSPDGSFSENSLSGAAATVPIISSTTFTISCLDPNGNPITDDVTVTISS